MKCPYNISIEQVTQTTYEYDDEGKTKLAIHKLVEKRILIECLQKECGAWQNNKCTYNNLKDK